MKTSGIYRIDLGNNNFYIGSAVNLARREHQHRTELKREVHDNIKMQNCWNKYGVFGFTVLEECVKDDLIIREQFHIDQHRDNEKMTNIALTAGSRLGVKQSDETRANMSAAAMGRVHSDESRAKISAGLMGRVPSAGTRAKLSAAQKLRVSPSDETRTKMSLAALARHAKMRLEKQLLKEVA